MTLLAESRVICLVFFLWCCFSLTLGKLYCPPLVAPKDTNLTCNLPNDKENISCSSSWLPSGTIAYFECKYYENQTKHMGQIKCKGRYSEAFMTSFKSGRNDIPPPMPCEISEKRSSPEFHLYGYGKSNLKDSNLMQWENVNHNFISDTDINALGLKLHNQFRKLHNSPPLEVDPQLVQTAESWARTLSRRSYLDMAPEPVLGQNVYRSSANTSVAAVNDAIQFWYKVGLSHYNWVDVKSNWDNSLALDFSQIVWKSSRKIGIGVSPNNTDIQGGFFVVAFYSPQGNIVLEDSHYPESLFVQNVLPKSAEVE